MPPASSDDLGQRKRKVPINDNGEPVISSFKKRKIPSTTIKTVPNKTPVVSRKKPAVIKPVPTNTMMAKLNNDSGPSRQPSIEVEEDSDDQHPHQRAPRNPDRIIEFIDDDDDDKHNDAPPPAVGVDHDDNNEEVPEEPEETAEAELGM